ncbi:hypothetical protein KEM48_010692 [Puccinia striiformis f. sp. tritici PST-130]|nr:hypothetical protein KEM48_010692 [Puccinia striiformis f. sp. tritici PST-130]
MLKQRKAGIMKKAYELATLTGTQLLLLWFPKLGLYTRSLPLTFSLLVSDDPGKSLISSCLNDGEAEIRIEQEDPEDELPANPAAAAEEQDLMVMPSNHPVTSSTDTIPYFHQSSEHLSQPYDSIFLSPTGIQNMYPNLGQQIGSSASDSLSTIPNLQICPPAPTSMNLQENQPMFSMDGFMQLGDPSESRKIKRRRTETDLRQRAALSSQSTATPPLPSQFPFEVQNNWLETPDQMKLGPISANQGTVFDSPAFNTVVSSFLLRECNNFYSPIELETTNRNLQSQVEHNVVLFLDACDHYPLGDSTLGPRKWRQELFPRKELLAECLKFFFEEYLPLMKHLPLESLTSCCEDLQKLVQFASIFYGAPEQDAAELCETEMCTEVKTKERGENSPEGITAVFKIRFPASAIKLIRKEDKLELEVQNSDDGKNLRGKETALIRGAKMDRKPTFDEVVHRGWGFDDDGFESKVPPKGGKQAFRVKKPSIAGPKTSDSSQFELEDLVNMKGLNSPH